MCSDRGRPPARVPPLRVASLDAAIDTLRRSGARVDVVYPDEASQAVFASVGGNLLDPSVREAATRAGREQGRRFHAHTSQARTSAHRAPSSQSV